MQYLLLKLLRVVQLTCFDHRNLKKIRVVVVDDSALVRSLLVEIINRQTDMECVGAAQDPLVAREMIRELNPDVLTLDIEMPRMDGIDFLSRLMRLRPMPVIMISTLTERGAEVTMTALGLGAVDFVSKPRIGVESGFKELSGQIVEKIRIAALAHVNRTVVSHDVSLRCKLELSAESRLQVNASRGILTEKMVFIGASTGGTEAIKEVISQLPLDFPAIAITQHMPAGFTASFAARLNALCRISVCEAVNGQHLLPGHAYIAPGGKQFWIERRDGKHVAIVEDGAPVNRHKPSVEVLFQSAARHVGRNAIGIMLTGMGNDGAKALREMKDAGSYNFVQDEMSCVVFGMPREAIAHGAADEVLPLSQIAPALIARLHARQ